LAGGQLLLGMEAITFSLEPSNPRPSFSFSSKLNILCIHSINETDMVAIVAGGEISRTEKSLPTYPDTF
jgi:hypothetical protein